MSLIHEFKSRILEDNENPDKWILDLEEMSYRLQIEHSEVINSEEMKLMIIGGLSGVE